MHIKITNQKYLQDLICSKSEFTKSHTNLIPYLLPNLDHIYNCHFYFK